MDDFNDLNKNINEDTAESVSAEFTGSSPAEPEETELNKKPNPESEPDISHIEYNEGSAPPEEKKPESKKLYIPVILLLILIFTAISALTIYFIYTDVRTGSIEFNKQFSGNNNSGYTLNLNGKPSGNKNPQKDENGKYTTEGLAEYIRPQIVEIYAYSSSSAKKKMSCGSGIIISEDGYIITNTHILENTLSAVSENDAESPDNYVVITSDQTKYTAKVVGRDKKTDIAVVKIEAKGLPCAELGNSDETVVGEHVVAIGNPEGFVGSVTEGIVSGVNRLIKEEATGYAIDCIQTDAAINYGSSGGALVNMYGQIIGITSSKQTSYEGIASEGLGFAISINYAKPIIEDIITQGYVSGRVRVGITFYSMDTAEAIKEFKEKYKTDIPEKIRGLWITDISNECDISKTELKAGDFIIEVNGKKINNYNDLCAVIENKKGGDTLKAKCARIEKDMNISYFDIEFKLMEDTSGDF